VSEPGPVGAGILRGVVEQDNLPRWRGERGRYEVWFLTASDPTGRVGYWLRYTIRAPVAGPPEPRLWFAAFDRDDPSRTFGVNAAVAPDRLRLRRDRFEVEMGDSIIELGRATGTIEGGGHRVRWDLAFPAGGPSFRPLPDLLSRRGLAPTLPFSSNPDTALEGTIEIDGDVRRLDRVPAQQGHLFGSRHAERWAWASCSSFQGDGVAFQALSAQSRRGPLITPFLTFGGIRLGDRWVRLRGAGRRRDWGLGWWRIGLVGRAYRVEGEVRAEPQAMVRARYLDPDDTPRYCHNSEVSSCRLTVWERRPGGWQLAARLRSDGTTHAEWAGRTPAPGVGIEHVEVA
jgi:hypothetical protein